VPTYDYSCPSCGHIFELLVLPGKSPPPRCPSCENDDVERLISGPMVQTDGTRDMSLRSAQRRESQRGEERVREQRRYEREHEGH